MAISTKTIETVSPGVRKQLDQIAPPEKKLDLGKLISVSLTLNRPGNKIGVATDDVITADTDKGQFALSKTIFDSESFRKVRSHDVAIRQYIKTVCLPNVDFLKGGTFLVPPDLVVTVDEKVNAMFVERRALVDAFIAEYPVIIVQAKEKLRAMFNAADYPQPSVLRTAFSEDIDYYSFTKANGLANISEAIFEREQAKAQAKVDALVVDIERTLYLGAKSVVDDLLSKLSGATDEGGKAKQIRGDAVGNLRKFFEDLKSRNLTNDANLASIADKGIKALEGVETKALKSSDIVKKKVQDAFQAISEIVNGTVVDKPTRKIKL